MRRMADMISERQMELAALMAIEVGKNRLESLGDVEETADLIRYYCDQFVANDGFDHAMGNLGDTTVHTRSCSSLMRLGDHQPVQLPHGPVGGPRRRLVAGNAVVYKPSSDSPLCGVKLPRSRISPACRAESSTWSAPGPRLEPSCRRTKGRRPALHRLVRDRIQRRLQDLQQEVPQARHRGDGGKNPPS